MTDTKAPIVSVIMPAYNSERYLAEAVESILAQTFEDFEFLIIDDGSTDGSLAILKRYAGRDARIRLVSRPNTGYVIALNEMLAMARGEYIARMDSDDVALPGRFAAQVGFLESHPDISCVGGATQWIDEIGHVLRINVHPTDNATIQESSLLGICPFCHPTVMLRREALMSVGGYDPAMYPAEDVDLWLRLGEVGKMANLEEVVLKYRFHSNSVTQNNQELGMARVQTAVNRSCERRGLDRHCPPLKPNRNVTTPFDCALNYGWWGFIAGHRSAAIHHGMQAIRRKPWRPAGWKLLGYGLLRTPGSKSTEGLKVEA